MEFSEILSLINYGFVLFFGIVVSLCFADINFRNHKIEYVVIISGFVLAQALFYIICGEKALHKFYPLLIHIPLIMILYFIFKQNIYVSFIAVISAYLLCTPRKWFGTAVSYFFNYSTMVADIVSVIVTIPFLAVIIKYISPYMVKLKYESRTILTLFLVLPFAYYVLEYAFTVYTDLLYTGGAVALEFMDSFIVILYIIFSLLTVEILSRKAKAERENVILSVAASHAQKELTRIYNAEKQTAIYRHDLRHHMNFIRGCIDEERYEDAKEYINKICNQAESYKVVKYCKNEAVNIILSYYIERAKEQNTEIAVNVTAEDFSRFQITDLCSLISNALENAVNACEKIENGYINIKIYEKNKRLCINIANSCYENIDFENDIPISKNAGHRIGVKSMASVVEKYGGVYGFFADGKEFRFQASM